MNNLTKCPDCESDVSVKAMTCPRCGHPFKKEQTAGGVLAAILLGFLISWFLFHLF